MQTQKNFICKQVNSEAAAHPVFSNWASATMFRVIEEHCASPLYLQDGFEALCRNFYTKMYDLSLYLWGDQQTYIPKTVGIQDLVCLLYLTINVPHLDTTVALLFIWVHLYAETCTILVDDVATLFNLPADYLRTRLFSYAWNYSHCWMSLQQEGVYTRYFDYLLQQTSSGRVTSLLPFWAPPCVVVPACRAHSQPAASALPAAMPSAFVAVPAPAAAPPPVPRNTSRARTGWKMDALIFGKAVATPVTPPPNCRHFSPLVLPATRAEEPTKLALRRRSSRAQLAANDVGHRVSFHAPSPRRKRHCSKIRDIRTLSSADRMLPVSAMDRP